MLDSYDFSSYAQATLKRFTGIDACEKRINEVHNPTPKQKQNVRKQAFQIKSCVTVALDYLEAYRSVSLSTKPLLMYYCIMNLALAETLLKGDGFSSLDINRDQHSHHGLSFSLNGLKSFSDLDNALSLVCAKPHVASGERKGTFHLWHKASREYPIIGKTEVVQADAIINRFEVLAFPNDYPPKDIPESGIRLSECLIVIPGLADYLISIGKTPMLVKSALKRKVYEGNRVYSEIVIQPADRKALLEVVKGFEFSASAQHEMNLKDVGGGIIIENNIPLMGLQPNDDVFMNYPTSFQAKRDELYYCASDFNINEFGLYYVSMYMLGNIVRYYPDLWAKSVSAYDEFAYIVDRLLEVVEDRVPKLAASELMGIYLLE